MTKFIKKPIAEASLAELRDFAQRIGVEDAETAASEVAVMALLAPAWDQDFITIGAVPDVMDLGQDEPASPAGEPVGGGREMDRDPKVELTVNQSPLAGGKHPVAVGVNGDTLVIQRGRRVSVPYRFYLALCNSSHTEMQWEGEGSREAVPKMNDITYHEISNYPLQVHKLPSEHEIAAWHAETCRREAEARQHDEAARKLAA